MELIDLPQSATFTLSLSVTTEPTITQCDTGDEDNDDIQPSQSVR